MPAYKTHSSLYPLRVDQNIVTYKQDDLITSAKLSVNTLLPSLEAIQIT